MFFCWIFAIYETQDPLFERILRCFPKKNKSDDKKVSTKSI